MQASRSVGLSLARISFEAEIDRRTSLDAARLVSRLVRSADFACRQNDGSILFVFADTDLRSAHVAARRLASVLKHTMLRPDREQPAHQPDGDASDAEVDRHGAHLARAGHAAPGCRRLSGCLRLGADTGGPPCPTPQSRSPRLQIDVVSDVVCPWCFIGKRRLEKALALKPDIPVEVRFHPYFLNPWVPREGMAATST